MWTAPQMLQLHPVDIWSSTPQDTKLKGYTFDEQKKEEVKAKMRFWITEDL